MKLKIIKPTPFGSVAIIWSIIDGSPKIIRILLSNPDLSAEDKLSTISPDFKLSSSPEIDSVALDIKAFLRGEDVLFSLDMVALELCSSFQRSVLHAEYQIPRGRVSTYKLIADHIGKEKGARAVGNALARNPFPIIIPCHRAIRSDGHLGGFQGGVDMKRALLEKEGIKFDDQRRVLSSKFYYE